MGFSAIMGAVEELLTRSPTLSLAGLALLGTSPSQVATSRSSDDPLLDTVQSRLASGALFPVDGKRWAGLGGGKSCAVCDLTINNSEIEYEVTGGPSGSAFAHVRCYLVWRQESEALRLS